MIVASRFRFPSGAETAPSDYSGGVDPAGEFSDEAVVVSDVPCIRPNSSRAYFAAWESGKWAMIAPNQFSALGLVRLVLANRLA